MNILFRITILVSVCMLTSCKSTKNAQINSQYKNKSEVLLTEDQQTKFDVFFYESLREKMLGNYEKSASYLGECLRIDPNSSVSMYELANLFILNKQFVKAQVLLEKAIEINPTNVWYSLFLADLYQNNGLGDKAIKIYESLVLSTPSNEEYLFMLAQLYAQNGRSTEAVVTYNKLEDIVGLNEVISREKIALYVKLNNKKGALAEVDKLIRKYPYDANYVEFKGDLFVTFKQYDDARKCYLETITVDSTYDVVNFSLSNLAFLRLDKVNQKSYFLKGLYSPNVALDVKIEKLLPYIISNQPDTFFLLSEQGVIFNYLTSTYNSDSRVFVLTGDYHKRCSNTTEALKAFKHAAEINRGNERVWEQLLMLELELRLYSEIVSDATIALDNFPQNTMFYMMLSSAYVQLNQPKNAVAVLIKALDFVDGDNKQLLSQIHSSMGDAYFELDSVDQAFNSYDIALSFNDRNLNALNNYSYYLSLVKRDLDKAEKMSARTVELEPGNSTFLDTYAWVLFQKGLYVEAKFIIERAIMNDKEKNSTIIEHYGDILYYNGDIVGALEQWEAAYKAGVDSKFILEKINNKRYID